MLRQHSSSPEPVKQHLGEGAEVTPQGTATTPAPTQKKASRGTQWFRFAVDGCTPQRGGHDLAPLNFER